MGTGMTRLWALLMLAGFLFFVPAVAQVGHHPDRSLEVDSADPEAHALYMLQAAREKLALGDTDGAIAMAEKAVIESPDFPCSYFLLSRIYLSDDLSHAALLFSDGVIAWLRNFRWSLATLGGGAALLLLATIVSVFIGWVVLFLKSAPLVLHDLKEGNIDWRILLLSAASVFLGLFYPICFFSIILWPYFVRREKLFLCVFPLVMIISYWTLTVIASNFLFPVSPRLKAVVAVQEGHRFKYALDILNPPESDEERFSLAMVFSKNRDHKRAIELYSGIDNKWKYYDIVLNNIGSSYYKLGQPEKAIEYFEKAFGSGLSSVEYNLSQVYRDGLLFDKGERLFKNLQARDPDSVFRFMSSDRVVVDEPLPRMALWSLALRSTEQMDALRSALWKPLLGIIPLKFAPGTGAVLLVLFFILESRPKKRPQTYKCRKCGSVHCGRCEKRLFKANVCNSCYLGSLRIDQSDPQERIAKILQTQKHYDNRMRVTKLLAFFPGLGSYFLGHWLSGFLLLSGFILSFEVMFLTDFLFWIPFSMNGFNARLAGLITACGLVVTSFYLVKKGVLHGWR